MTYKYLVEIETEQETDIEPYLNESKIFIGFGMKARLVKEFKRS